MEGIKSGAVSLDNPSVRSLLETCAANGIGTAGLNPNNNANNFVNHPAADMGGGGGGGRKSPGAGGKKSASPSASSGSAGKKKASVARGAAAGNGGNGTGSSKVAAAAASAAASRAGAGAPAANGDAKKSGGGGGGGKGKAAAKAEASKGEAKTPKSSAINVAEKSPPAPKSAAPKSATPKSAAPKPATPKSTDKTTARKGKVGLAVPKTLYPELVRLIENGGEFQSLPTRPRTDGGLVRLKGTTVIMWQNGCLCVNFLPPRAAWAFVPRVVYEEGGVGRGQGCWPLVSLGFLAGCCVSISALSVRLVCMRACNGGIVVPGTAVLAGFPSCPLGGQATSTRVHSHFRVGADVVL